MTKWWIGLTSLCRRHFLEGQRAEVSNPGQGMHKGCGAGIERMGSREDIAMARGVEPAEERQSISNS